MTQLSFCGAKGSPTPARQRCFRGAAVIGQGSCSPLVCLACRHCGWGRSDVAKSPCAWSGPQSRSSPTPAWDRIWGAVFSFGNFVSQLKRQRKISASPLLFSPAPNLFPGTCTTAWPCVTEYLWFAHFFLSLTFRSTGLAAVFQIHKRNWIHISFARLCLGYSHLCDRLPGGKEHFSLA